MKKFPLFLALVLVFGIRAQAACSAITGTLYQPDTVTPYAGTVQVSLGYTISFGTITIPPGSTSPAIVRGKLSACLAAGTYTVAYSGGIIRYWTVTSPGPLTIQQIETVTPPTPPIYTLSVLPPLVYSAGVISLTPDTSHLANGNYCVVITSGAITGYTTCSGGGGGALSWAAVSSVTWASLTSATWSSLTI